MYNNGDAATLHIENAQIPLFQAKIQELLPSLHSRLRFSQLWLPLTQPPHSNSTHSPLGSLPHSLSRSLPLLLSFGPLTAAAGSAEAASSAIVTTMRVPLEQVRLPYEGAPAI